MKGEGEAGGGSQGGGGAHSGAIGDDDNAARRPSRGRAAGQGFAGRALGGPRSPTGPQSWAARPPRLAAQASARSIAARGSAAVKYGLRRGKLSARSQSGPALGQSSGQGLAF